MKYDNNKKENKKIFFPLTYCNDSKEMLWQQYVDDIEMNMFENEKMINVIKHLNNNLTDFEKTLWLIYSEYNNYRLTAEETNISASAVYKIVGKIREEIKEILINK